MKKRKEALSILIGADMESDIREIFSGKPISKIIQPRNALYLDTYQQLDKLLSPKKMDLLRYLMETQAAHNPKSVSEIANELGRHQEAISRDLSSLKRLGLVVLKRFKQTVYALPLYSRIDIRVCP